MLHAWGWRRSPLEQTAQHICESLPETFCLIAEAAGFLLRGGPF